MNGRDDVPRHPGHQDMMLHGISGQLTDALNRLTCLETQIMALADDLKAGIKKLDDETNAVAANIAQLASRITNSMSDQDVADVKAALAAESERLGTLAQDPTVPVPPEPPALAAARKK